jgi:beta-mannosidase
MTSINKFADPKDQNIAAPVLESHQKDEGGNARIAETMFRYFRWPEKFDDFVYVSQVQQGLAIRTAVTHWRSLKPRCMGTLIWQLNDTWPVCSWASLNHGGDWKLLHHMAQEFYAPVLITAVPEGHALTLRGINDAAETANVSLAAQAVDMAGQTRMLIKADASLDDVAVDIVSIANGDLKADEMLLVDWETGGVKSRLIHAPKPYKAYDLQDPKINIDVKGNEVTLTAHGLSLFTALEADVTGRFSANAFDMLPGESRTITFTPTDAGATPTFTLRNLHSATTA